MSRLDYMRTIQLLRSSLSKLETYRKCLNAIAPATKEAGIDLQRRIKAELERLGECSWIETMPDCNCKQCRADRYEEKMEARIQA